MIRILILLLTLLPVGASAQEATATFGTGSSTLLLRSTTDLSVIRPVMERFTERNPDIRVSYEQWGSNALFEASRNACEGEGMSADAVFTSAVHQALFLVNAACARPYRSALTTALPEARRWRDELWGISEEPAVIVYNSDALEGDRVPRSRFELLDLMRRQPEALRGRIATYDIEASGLGYLFAHADSLEASTFGAMLEALARMDAIATCCSAEIIDGVASGRYHIAYNVLGSYAAQRAGRHIGVILPEDYTLVLSRAYLIPKQAGNAPAAERLLDFLLGAEAQTTLADIGLVMSVDPSETGLLPSARRLIPLSPPLLRALDGSTRAHMFHLWANAFERDGGG